MNSTTIEVPADRAAFIRWLSEAPVPYLEALDRIARQEATLGKLDSARLDACLARQDETQIKASLKEADALGLEGTPELFVDGERINGAVPKEQLWAAIDRALRAHGEQPPPETASQAPQPAGAAGAAAK